MSTLANPIRQKDLATGRERQERRRSSRHKATLRPCCIVSDGDASIGLMNNFSSKGAQIEAQIDGEVGDEISYFWEVRSCMRARIVWNDGQFVGLEHVEDSLPDWLARFAPRSLRVPCDVPARCWVAGKEYEVTVQNLSLAGIGVRDLPELAPRTKVRIKFCGVEFSLATVRWQNQNSTGLSLSKQMSDKEMARLLTTRSFGFSQSKADSNRN